MSKSIDELGDFYWCETCIQWHHKDHGNLHYDMVESPPERPNAANFHGNAEQLLVCQQMWDEVNGEQPIDIKARTFQVESHYWHDAFTDSNGITLKSQ